MTVSVVQTVLRPHGSEVSVAAHTWVLGLQQADAPEGASCATGMGTIVADASPQQSWRGFPMAVDTINPRNRRTVVHRRIEGYLTTARNSVDAGHGTQDAATDLACAPHESSGGKLQLATFFRKQGW